MNGLNQTLLASPLPIDTWTHIALTYDNNNHLVYYQNGSLGTSIEPFIYPSSQLPVTLRIGYLDTQHICNDTSIISESFSGTIDEFRIYSRDLSPENVRAIMGEQS